MAKTLAEAVAKPDTKTSAPIAEGALSVRPPKISILSCTIVGDPNSPYVQHRFSAKARNKMKDTQAAGSTSKSKKVREAKDFDEVYKDATHTSTEGWHGIPAASLRSAMISACRVSGMVMTISKLSLFVEADGRDNEDQSPLVRIHGEPQPLESHVRNQTGVADVRRRPAWYDWSADLRIVYDADVFKPDDILALLMRAGAQVGIGEGRHDSKKSNGQGWGVFSIAPGSVTVTVRSLENDIAKLYKQSKG